MIEKNDNVYSDPRVKRIVEIHPSARQITLEDSRFYQRMPGIYYPSVTYILSYFPKDRFFENWIKDVGHNADIIMQRAGKQGTQVHEAIEKILKGEEVVWIEENGFVNYSTEVWSMILRFVDFWNTHKPKLLATECHLFSDEHQFAGTGDLVLEINDEVWLVDIKTSNYLHTIYELQTAAYAVAWNETHNIEIDKTAILWLKASTRGPDKSGKKIQGSGWQLKEPDEHYLENFQSFKLIYDVFKLKNKDCRPVTEILPLSIKLDI